MPRATQNTTVLFRFAGPGARGASEPSASSASAEGDGIREPLARALSREWLETDGRGGYAASTIALCPTRRYHGLLVGPQAGSPKRHVFLSRFEEHVLIEGTPLAAISMAAYGETYAPEGFQALTSFELAPYPRFVYRVGEGELEREIMMLRGSQTVLVRYRLRGGPEGATLALRPIVPMREADDLTVQNDALEERCELLDGGIRTQPYAALPALSIRASHPSTRFAAEATWFRGLSYDADERRGYRGREDQFSPGVLSIPLDGEVVVAASTGQLPTDLLAAWRKEAKRRCKQAKEALAERSLPSARMHLAADDFLYRSQADRPGVIAGYPWFGEWGRDTFLALPGLTLARGDLKGCAEVLSGALEFLRDGLLPNVFGTSRTDSHYDSADASLWFARAVSLWDEAGGGEAQLLDEFLPALEEIASCYRDGTGLGIAADESELVRLGSPNHNPTWMDARTADGAVTPRDGFPVEINALWYSLLAHLEELSGRSGDKKAKKSWTALRRKAKRSFVERFWLEDEEYLADVWKDGRPDPTVRPNMVIAAALATSPLTRKQRAGVVRRAEAELLTERGLRTLSPTSAAFRPRYEGGPAERDAAYHQGTVWPWLSGFYGEAKLRSTSGSKKEVLAELRAHLAGFAQELDQSGLNHVSEVFDGSDPQRGGGTVAQAWNTAELLRLEKMLAP